MSVWKTDKKKLLIFASLISPSKIILFEKWYQVFHHQINHLEVLQKHSAAHVVFSMRLSSMFHLVKKPVGWGGGVAWMKHCFLWLIYYISNRPDVMSRWPFHSCTIFEAYPMNALRFSEVWSLAFHSPGKAISPRKRKPKLFGFENAMEKGTRKILAS